MMPYISQHTRDVSNLSYEYDCDLITGFPFAFVSVHARLRNALHHEVHEIDGYNQEFWKLRAIL